MTRRRRARHRQPHLEVVKARLHRALVALRDRLVAIYESGTPDVLSVILGSDDYDEMVSRTEYLERIQGMDEAIVGRVRELRDQVKSTVNRLRSAKNRIEAARDAIAAEEQALASARQAVQERQSASSRSAPTDGGPRKDRAAEDELDGDVADIQAEIAATLAGYGSVAASRRPDQAGLGSGLIWPVDGPVVSGFEMRWGRPHKGIDIAVPGGPRSAPRLRLGGPAPGRSGKRRLWQFHLPRSWRRALHLLRPPVLGRGQLGSERLPGRRDRLRRLHRPLLRRPPALRGPDQRRTDRSDGLPVVHSRLKNSGPENPIFGRSARISPCHAG